MSLKVSDKSKRVLEFDKIKELLKEKTSSELTREFIEGYSFMSNLKEIDAALDETDEAIDAIVKKSQPPLFGIRDLSSILKRLELGAHLDMGSLLFLADNLRVSSGLKNYIKSDDDVELKILNSYIDQLYSNRNLQEEIESKIISEEEMADDASRELLLIRRSMGNKKEEIRDKLNDIIRGDRKYLQDSIITFRNDRFVVPVKKEHKSKVKGLVHDMSSSKSTLYIEPIAVVRLNNELKELGFREKKEIEKIIGELSEKCMEFTFEFARNTEILKLLDFIFAKAKLALSLECSRPILNDKKILNLNSAIHPLLDRETAVPIDIRVGEDFRTLIITGPNTGGKTVSLKTVGVSVLMTHFGLFIPAAEKSEIPILNKVYADIGDEQSIEQSLSTFSSHMTNIVDIIDGVDSESLVLFDELGAGTDPTEGAALAKSIIEYILNKDALCIATTHYNQLKIYALKKENVQNASMEFDVQSLRPTYKLIIGLPGKSNAFEISKRLGLRSDIIDEAGKYLSTDELEFESVLKDIEADRLSIKDDKIKSKKEKLLLLEKNKKLERELEKLESAKEKELKQAKEEARKLVRETKAEMELLIEEIEDLRANLSREENKRLQQAKDFLRDRQSDLKTEGLKIKEAKEPIRELKLGDMVKTTLGQKGTVAALEDSRGDVTVQIGIMKLKIPKSSLERCSVEEEIEKVKTKEIIRSKSQSISTELDLRGRTFDDAKIEVDKYLDDAYLANLKYVRLIHGKGSGALREKLRRYLRSQKYIKKFEDAPYNEGGDGVTVVHFK